MIRECREEIGATVEVHQAACLFEIMRPRRTVGDASIPPFHQVNVAYWCGGLAEGEEPGEGTDPDSGQDGTAWQTRWTGWIEITGCARPSSPVGSSPIRATGLFSPRGLHLLSPG